MSKLTGNSNTVRELLKRIPDAMDHFRKLVVQKDQKKSEKEAREYSTASFHITYGEETSHLNAEIAQGEEHCAQLKKSITAQKQLIAKTDRMILIKDKLKRDIPDEHDRGVRKWLDVALGVICIIAALFVLGMGASNVFAIIMASGTPIFLEEPKLAWMLSGLLPLGAFALEFFKRHLYLDQTKKIYTLLIFALAALLLVVWVVLFALVFGSPGDDSFDLDSLIKPEKENHIATAFTMVQLLAELFVGASLFTTAGDLFAKYSPTKLTQNPNLVEAEQLLVPMEKEYEAANAALIKKKARLEVLNHALTLHLSEQMVAYMRIRAQLVD